MNRIIRQTPARMQAFFTHERKQLSRKKVTMSEVSDATQIIMMTARGGYLLGKISIKKADNFAGPTG